MVSIYSYLSIVAIDFPVIFGYGNGELMNERQVFIENIALIFFSGIVAAVWGRYIAAKNILSFSKEHIFLLLLICSLPLSTYINIRNIEELTPFKMILHMVGSENDFANNARKQEYLIQQIVSSPDEDVIVHSYKEPPEAWINTREIGLNEDPTYWVNNNVAIYFGKKSITVVFDDVQGE